MSVVSRAVRRRRERSKTVNTYLVITKYGVNSQHHTEAAAVAAAKEYAGHFPGYPCKVVAPRGAVVWVAGR